MSNFALASTSPPPLEPGIPARHPRAYCDKPIEFFPPLGEVALDLICVLAKGHTNDHMAVFGSEDHEPPVTVELRWSQR